MGAMDFNKYVEEVTKEMNKTKKWIAKRTTDKMRAKLIKVYDSIIDDFYSSYTPSSYRRHDVEAFTNEGINLHRALATSSSLPPKYPAPHTMDGGIIINSDDMADYRYKVAKEQVLAYILDGVRFPSWQTDDGIYGSAMTFEAHYEDAECNATGTPLEVLNSIRDQLADKYYLQALEEAKKELKLNYVSLD